MKKSVRLMLLAMLVFSYTSTLAAGPAGCGEPFGWLDYQEAPKSARQLIDLIRQGKATLLKKFLSDHPRVNLNLVVDGRTPLQLAAKLENLPILRALANDQRIDPNIVIDGAPLIHWAARQSNEVFLIVANLPGINLEAPDRKGKTILYKAAETYYENFAPNVASIINRLAVNTRFPHETKKPDNTWQITALEKAIFQCKARVNCQQLELIEALVNHAGTELDQKIPNRLDYPVMPIWHAVASQNVQVIRIYSKAARKKMIDPNVLIQGQHLLDFALHLAHDIKKRYNRNGKEVEITRKNRYEIFDALIMIPGIIKQPYLDRRELFDIVDYGTAAELKDWFAKRPDADLNLTNGIGEPLLYRVVASAHSADPAVAREVVKKINVLNGINEKRPADKIKPNQFKDSVSKMTAIHLAAQGDWKLFEAVARIEGVDFAKKNQQGDNALMIAARYQNYRAVNWMLENAPIAINALNKSDETAAYILLRHYPNSTAKKNTARDSLLQMINQGARLVTRGKTPLFNLAIQAGDQKLVQSLISLDQRLGITTGPQGTLQLAIQHGMVDLVLSTPNYPYKLDDLLIPTSQTKVLESYIKKFRARITARDANLALHQACQIASDVKTIEIIGTLEDLNPNFRVRNQVPGYHLAQREMDSMLAALAQLPGFDPNLSVTAQDSRVPTSLIVLTAAHGLDGALQQMLAIPGADPDGLESRWGKWGALHAVLGKRESESHAIMRARLATVRILLEAGADPHSTFYQDRPVNAIDLALQLKGSFDDLLARYFDQNLIISIRRGNSAYAIERISEKNPEWVQQIFNKALEQYRIDLSVTWDGQNAGGSTFTQILDSPQLQSFRSWVFQEAGIRGVSSEMRKAWYSQDLPEVLQLLGKGSSTAIRIPGHNTLDIVRYAIFYGRVDILRAIAQNPDVPRGEQVGFEQTPLDFAIELTFPRTFIFPNPYVSTIDKVTAIQMANVLYDLGFQTSRYQMLTGRIEFDHPSIFRPGIDDR